MSIMQADAVSSQEWLVSTNGQHPESKDGLAVSEDRYWQQYYEDSDFNYEWNNGILAAKPMAKISQSNMFGWFSDTIRQFNRVTQTVDFTMLEIGFELFLPSGKKIRKPDLGVIRRDNPVPIRLHERTYRGTYDLCVESLSDSSQGEIERDTIHKYSEYAQIGVREYYILDDQMNRHTGFYWRDAAGNYVEIQPTADGVIRSVVLPGFQFRIDDLYRQPDLFEMSSDPVYQTFVWPEYRREKIRAEQEFQARLAESAARHEAEEKAKHEEVARRQAEEQAKMEAIARQEAEAENARLLAELAKLRNESGSTES